MNRLIYAGFLRLRHSACFWTGILVMAAVGLILPLQKFYLMQKYEGYAISLEECFLTYVPLIVIIAAVFCSLFIGTEYSDGTIRNKIMLGHSRIDVYLSNLIICFAAECVMCLAFFVTDLGAGILLLGFFASGVEMVLAYVGCVFVLCAAVTAIYTLAAMLSQNKAVTAVICILGIVLMIFWGAYIDSRLDMPPVYEGYLYQDSVTGEYIEEEDIPNPYYIDGTKRVVYEFLNDFLPGNQTAQFWMGNAVHLWQMALYSAIVTVVVTGAGIFFFRREDLK